MPQSDPNKALPLVAMGPTSRFIGEAYKKLGKEAIAASSPAVKKVATKIGSLASKATKTNPKVANTGISDEAMTSLGKASVVGAGATVAALPLVEDKQIEQAKKVNRKPLPPKISLALTKVSPEEVREATSKFSKESTQFYEKAKPIIRSIEEYDRKLGPKMIGKPTIRPSYTGLGRSSMKANPTLRQGE